VKPAQIIYLVDFVNVDVKKKKILLLEQTKKSTHVKGGCFPLDLDLENLFAILPNFFLVANSKTNNIKTINLSYPNCLATTRAKIFSVMHLLGS